MIRKLPPTLLKAERLPRGFNTPPAAPGRTRRRIGSRLVKGGEGWEVLTGRSDVILYMGVSTKNRGGFFPQNGWFIIYNGNTL